MFCNRRYVSKYQRTALFHFIVNRAYRLNAYRNFICWVYGKLGRGNRKVVPSCFVNSIHKEFPDPNGNYTGFLEGTEDHSEYDSSWVLELVEIIN